MSSSQQGNKSFSELLSSGKGLLETLFDSMQDGIYFLDGERRILFWNKAAEDITGYEKSEIVGRRCSDHLLNHIDEHGTMLCGENCPVQHTLSDGIPRFLESYLLHKIGYRKPVNLKVFPCQENDGSIYGAVQLFSDASPKVSMSPRLENLDLLAFRNDQTEIGNRRFLETFLDSHLKEMHQYQIPIGLLYVDIDKFTQINESYGRFIGDKVLGMVAKTLANNIRFTDVAGRWKEDKFLVAVLNVDTPKLDLVANKLRLLVEKSEMRTENKPIGVTVSIGATIARNYDTVETLTGRAEKLMLQGKYLGRNRVASKF